jgi:Methane oxygenase PmoA
MRILSHCSTTVGLSLFLALACSAAAAEPPISIDSKVDVGQLAVSYQGRKLLVYAFATNQFKPYVRELYTLRGENVLRDSPPDHQHHHGLMYAVYVNGINFWEERDAPGIEKHVELPVQMARVDAKGTPVASFTEIIHWLAPTNRTASDSLAAALLIEQRTLTVTVDEKNQEVALRWDSAFQVGPNAGKVTLHGPNYDGLGLRLPESFNHVAKFQNSADQPYAGNNTQNVIATRWTSVSGAMDGREVMLALFGRPDNARGDGYFFSMLDPFAYLSATQGVDQKPLEYAAGHKFSLSYLLTVYSDNKPPEFIRRRGELWEKERR